MPKKVTSDKSEKEITILRQQVADLENKWKRSLADYLNLEKRIDKEKQDFVFFANSLLLLKVIDLLDDLGRCSKHLKDEGLCLVIQKFQDLLKGERVDEISVLGKQFDPQQMEAIEQVEGEKDKVVEVLSPGYKIADKILRPARVKVGRG